MIKRLNEKYFAEILELHKKAIFPLWDKLGRKYNTFFLKIFIKKIIKKEFVLGYIKEKKVIGVIGGSIKSKKREAEIKFLLVNPCYQGKGIGSKILKRFEKYSQDKVKKIILKVLIKNPAVIFYKKMGYSIISRKKNWYIMEKNI